jgi:redox-sensitive bicupin YhaK (pirin superfamily)
MRGACAIYIDSFDGYPLNSALFHRADKSFNALVFNANWRKTMTSLLHIDTSIFSTEGESGRLARAFVDRWRRSHPGATVITRDLALEPMPHLDAAAFRAYVAKPAMRSARDRATPCGLSATPRKEQTMTTIANSGARTLERVIESINTSDGAGVKLRRSIGRSQHIRVDPFLMLDEFSSDDPNDYIAGFPPHPHRGFETVTYMLDGHMRHEDHMGNRGELKAGGVQWMSAGRGIVHSEMPQQEKGRMRGFQLWINLPAAEKMQAPQYRDIQPQQIPAVDLPDGGRVKVIAGTLDVAGHRHPGPIQGLNTDPLYFDVELPAATSFMQTLVKEHNAFVYVYEGSVTIGAGKDAKPLATHAAGVLSQGAAVEITAGAQGARFLLLAGRPLHEPIVQHGPFVMNTAEEIRQAIADYQSGNFGS